jgi:hypothetical protein
MSLRGFHLLFITIAALFCAGLGGWALFLEESEGLGFKLFGGATLAVAIALVFYAISFRKKAKNIIV